MGEGFTYEFNQYSHIITHFIAMRFFSRLQSASHSKEDYPKLLLNDGKKGCCPFHSKLELTHYLYSR